MEPIYLVRTQSMEGREPNLGDLVPFSQSPWVLGDTPIGSGQYGRVYKAFSKHNPSITCAVKILKYGTTEDGGFNEVKALETLSGHPNCIELLGIYEKSGQLAICFDFCEGGDLFDRINSKRNYQENEARELLRNCLLAIKHAHDQHLAHADIKLENIFLCGRNDDVTIKIGDWGSSIDTNRVNDRAAVPGTLGYLAPEVLKGKGAGFHKAADMFALGVVAYCVMSGYPPWESSDYESPLSGTIHFHNQYWGHVSQDARDFIRSLLTVDPTQRLTVDGGLNHPWITLGSAKEEEVQKSDVTDGLQEENQEQTQEIVDVIVSSDTESDTETESETETETETYSDSDSEIGIDSDCDSDYGCDFNDDLGLSIIHNTAARNKTPEAIPRVKTKSRMRHRRHFSSSNLLPLVSKSNWNWRSKALIEVMIRSRRARYR